MSNLVTVTVKDHIADVRLNRPEKMNALNIPMFEAIAAAAEQVAADKSVRAVVLSGEGRAFCAGLDIKSVMGGGGANSGTNVVNSYGEGDSYPNFFQDPAYLWKAVPVPVICALHGVAFGGGLQIALGADIRIATQDVQMSVMEIKWGLIPDMTGSQTLRDLVRLDVAKELTFTGRIVDGNEAQSIGLVTRVSKTPLDDAIEMAKTIASKNPNAITYGKYLLENTWHGDDIEGLKAEEQLQAKLVKSHNQMAAVMAGMQKKEAEFKDRDINSFDEIELK